MTPSPWLTDAELADATHRQKPAAQARSLDAMGVPYKRRIDGTLLVGREAMARALSGTIPHTPDAPNGLQWSVRA